jgi:subtilisin family serine protease
MLSLRAASWRLSAGFLLALTAAVAIAAADTAGPASADSVRDAQQWVLGAVNAPAAWPVTQGQGVVVAVIDSGVNPSVSDLAGSVVSGPNLSGVKTRPANPDWGIHGTWMASLIAGHGHGVDSGVSGVAPKAKVLSIRVLPDRKDPAYAQYRREPASSGQRALAKAIRYAVAHRVSVISMSLGYGSSSRIVRSALQDAIEHKIVVVASSGNSGESPSDRQRAHAPYSFPADYPGVLGVAAIDQAGNPAKFSSDNLSVQVAAPGVQVPAQGNDGQYWLVSGTSPACALTSGVAALIKSVHPRMPPALVIRAITSSTQHRPPGGYDDRVGFGTVNAAAALTAAARLTKYVPDGHGLRASSHFGGGPAAIPPPPVRPRGLGQLLIYCLLAAACLVLTTIAASRLLLARARGAGGAAGQEDGE